MEKVENLHEQMGDFSTMMESIKESNGNARNKS
jgi:hypothetical protein